MSHAEIQFLFALLCHNLTCQTHSLVSLCLAGYFYVTAIFAVLAG